MPTEVTNNPGATEAIQSLARKPTTPTSDAASQGDQAAVYVERQSSVSSATRGGTILPHQLEKDVPKELPKEPPKEEVKKAVKQINDFIQSIQRELHFKVDDSTGRTVIKVIDSSTKEVIRTIPPEQALSLADVINNKSYPGRGLLLKDQA